MRGKLPETCASCTHFPRQALESSGPVECGHRELVTAWDHRACVLHSGVKRAERDARRPMVAALMKKEPEP